MPLWRRWWFRILGLILLAIAGMAFHVYWQRREAAEELRQVLAELDEAEPDWRLEQIEAKRRNVLDEENGALIVMKANRELPQDWQSTVREEIEKTPPPVRLADELNRQLQNELEKQEKAVVAARKVIDYTWGRYPATYTPDWLHSPVPEFQGARNVARLLQLDVCALIQEGQVENSWRSVQALLNTNRSLGDTPLFIGVLIRMEIQGQTVQCIERSLAHGLVADTGAARMQAALITEAVEPLFVTAMRGERAGMHQCFTFLGSGSISITANLEALTRDGRWREAGWYEHANDILAKRTVYRSHAWLVKHQTRMIEAAQKPPSERYAALHELDETAMDLVARRDKDYLLAAMFVRGLIKIAAAERLNDTLLNCTIAGLAAERFRLKHDRWPNSLDELVQAKLLAETPEDLYDGKPIRLRRAPDGIVFYSIGRDGNYEGDALDRLEDFSPNRTRVEFRLWDPAHRRQPPRQPPENP